MIKRKSKIRKKSKRKIKIDAPSFSFS